MSTLFVLKEGNAYAESPSGRIFAYHRELDALAAAHKSACSVVEVEDDPAPVEEHEDFKALESRAESAEEWVEKTEKLLRKKLGKKLGKPWLHIEDLLIPARKDLPCAEDETLHAAMCAWLELDPKTTTAAELIGMIPQ